MIIKKHPYSLILFGTLFFLSSCSHKPPILPKLAVQTLKVATSEIPIYKEYIGITQSTASVGIRARVKGFLIEKKFIEGKRVKKDDLLYVIDPKPFEAKLNLAKAQLARNIAAEHFQSAQYLRMKKLVAKGDISVSRYDEVEAQYHESVADIEIAKAQVMDAEINLGYCYMYSPIDGIAGVKHVDVGNLVGGAEDTLLVTINELAPMYIEFSPSISDFGEILHYRNNAPFKAEARLPHDNNLVLNGTVNFINNEAETSTSTLLMRATLENPEKLIVPGIYMNLKVILTEKGKVILVPIESVTETQGQRTVYIVNKKNEVESRSITVSGQYGERYIVKSGLNVGDLVILKGMQKIRPGQEVTLI